MHTGKPPGLTGGLLVVDVGLGPAGVAAADQGKHLHGDPSRTLLDREQERAQSGLFSGKRRKGLVHFKKILYNTFVKRSSNGGFLCASLMKKENWAARSTSST